MVVEHVYRYPRRITWPLELICAAFVGWAAIGVMRGVLLILWQRWPLDRWLLGRVRQLGDFVGWVQRTGPAAPSISTMLVLLGWLFGALLAALLLRSAFPAVRFSVRGLLVWFGNDWVPVRWEHMRAIRITESASGKRFALLVQTDSAQLTPYHRIYSLLYRLGVARGFWIVSGMRDGEDLVRDILDEIKRRRKLGETIDIKVHESSRSLLFTLLLSPLSLFKTRKSSAPVFQPIATSATLSNSAALTMPSMGGSSAVAPTSAGGAAVAAAPAGDVIRAAYPRAFDLVLNLCSVLIVGFALWRYLDAWRIFLRFVFPSLGEIALFNVQTAVISPWGLLLGAHVGLAVVAGVVIMLRHLFPSVAVDSGGVSLTALGRTQRLSWDDISFVKATDVRDEQHVVLLEAEGKRLPWYYIMGSWLYDGGTGRGALIWPLIQPFEPMMQRIALELTRRQQPDQPLRLRDDAPGWLLLLAVRPADALDRLVLAHEQADDMPTKLDTAAVIRAGTRMAWMAICPALLLLTYWVLYQGLIFSLQVPLIVILLSLWGMVEWPLAAVLASSLDQVVGAGTKAFQGLYLYPTAQLPRLLPLVFAIVLTLMGFPNLALVVWAAGIAWTAILTAGLWEALYGWRGLSLIGGSAMTVFFQILTLAGVLILRG